MSKQKTTPEKKPVHEIRLGAIKAAIWENETTNGAARYPALPQGRPRGFGGPGDRRLPGSLSSPAFRAGVYLRRKALGLDTNRTLHKRERQST